MVFKRREKRSWGRTLLEFFWPRGGWARAAQYVKIRLRRLPDSPEKIARGIFAGVFITFTPFFGLHFISAALLATIMRGNILASLLATFFGNPLTYVPIAATSLWFGHRILGTEPGSLELGQEVSKAWSDIWHNLGALFTSQTMEWGGLTAFYFDIFKPFMIGALVPGTIAGLIAYYMSVPVIRAYQTRRKGAIKAKFDALKAKSPLAKPKGAKQPGE